MKAIFLAVSCLLALSGAFATESCFQDVAIECSQASNSLLMAGCNADYGSYRHKENIVASEVQAYANLHLEKSFDFLLSSSYFKNYQTNRAGFSGLFRKLSDDLWEKSIDLIKHITMRGDEMDFSRRSTQKPTEKKNVTVELVEIEAMAQTLDAYKELAERAFFIHREATRNSQHLHDPEIAQYLEEEFIEDQAKLIRTLAGHTSDLKKFAEKGGKDLSLALFTFDEYLKSELA